MLHSQKETLENAIKLILKVIRQYEWLLDLYVLDFFVDNHWDKLPMTWRKSFQNLDPKDFGDFLAETSIKQVLPLTFLALIKSIKALSISRENQCFYSKTKNESICDSHPKMKNLFIKHVKLKKRHEIKLMADLISRTALETNCEAVIDFGSGLGHLMRILAYKHDLYTAGIECQSQLTEEARKLDLELEYTANKHLSEETMSQLRRPVHINMTLASNNQLHNISLPQTINNYGLVGLHPCGDLGPLLFKHFINCKQVKFICIAGCCYMKLSDNGYPMSRHVATLDSALSYASREIACHAIEIYIDKLQRGNYEDLKVHAYRAALERILVEQDPRLKHAPVRSIKHSDTMTFHRYCTLAVEKLGVTLPTTPSTWSRGQRDLVQWRRVIIVYTLRLVLAPLVETAVLLDRMLYVVEHGLTCEIHPVFDPKISPRNHIIIARR